jgi:hopanoid biosynthesis associated RND transporter like protein HpnN
VIGGSWTHLLARWMVRPLLGTWVRPNHLTTLRLISGLAACICLALATSAGMWCGGALWLVSALLDRADGELARIGNMMSARGHIYDYCVDNLVNTAFFVAIGFGLRHGWLGAWSVPLGLLSGGSLLACNIFSERLEARSPPGTRAYGGRWGFDPDDALYLLGPVAWLGWLTPLLVAASLGTTAMMLWTGYRLFRITQQAAIERKKRGIRVLPFLSRYPVLVAAAALVLAVAAFLMARADLGVTTDTGGLFAASLPWKRIQAELRHAFPQGEDLLVAVVDGAIPEEADTTAAALAAALAGDHAHFTEVRQPDAGPYLARNALLFADPKTLQDLLDQTIDAQPFLGKLAADPSLRGLLGALSLIAQGIETGQANLKPFEPALRAFHTALAAAAAGTPTPLSWETLLAGDLANMAGRYRFVLAKPVLDYGALQPGAAATAAIRAAAAKLEFVRDGAAHVRITGSVALDDEEFASVAQGAAGGLVASLVLVAVWLFLAVGSWRLMLPILLTLLLGLDLTAAFAALAVGTLNLVSVAFAVLFVGIAVDFAIQFTVRFREARSEIPDIASALRTTTRRAGGQILVAALATSAGFLAFTPTSFVGVAQLGLIAGIGMLIAFACTLTALPAFLALFQPPPEPAEIGFRWARPLDAAIIRRCRSILACYGVLALLGLALLPHLQFDDDPLHTKNQTTESVRTLNDLAADPVTNPYTIDVLAPSAAAAAALRPRLRALPEVDDVLSLASLVPSDQAAKLPLLEDAAALLLPTLTLPATAPPVTAAALRSSVQAANASMAAAVAKLRPDDPFVAIAGDLHRLALVPDATLLSASVALTRFLPMQFDRLRAALQAGPVTAADIPESIARDWITPDGRARLQVLPTRREARDSAGLHRFVAAVTAVAPGAGGSAVTIVRSADTIIAAFRTAMLAALAVIAVILLVALRRLRDTALVLAPLLLSSLLTVIVAVMLPLPLNFANIIALPLLLGVGVSFNVYFVMNWRAGRTGPLGSPTARAVLLSALTTATAFGSLALSNHPGTASMGKLLLVSLGCTLAVTLVFVPAILAAPPDNRKTIQPAKRRQADTIEL